MGYCNSQDIKYKKKIKKGEHVASRFSRIRFLFHSPFSFFLGIGLVIFRYTESNCVYIYTGVPTFSGSRGLGRGTRKAQTERRSSAGALLNASPPPPYWRCCGPINLARGVGMGENVALNACAPPNHFPAPATRTACIRSSSWLDMCDMYMHCMHAPQATASYFPLSNHLRRPSRSG
jgi:hypothetical protein